MDPIQRKSKPSNEEVGGIQNRIFKYPVELTIYEIAKVQVEEGRTIKTSYLTTSKKDSFISSSLVAIDIDNTIKLDGKKVKVDSKDYVTIDHFLSICKEIDLQPAIVYKTFSHTEDCHRFRAIFQLDRVISSVYDMDIIYNNIQGLLPMADTVVKSSSLIHGGCELVRVDPSAFIVADNYICTENLPHSLESKNASIKTVTRETLDTSKVTKENLINDILIEKYVNKTFESYYDLKKHLSSINLADLLRIDKPSKFNCLFHDDTNPSARIIEIDGEYIYQCFGRCTNHKRDIFNIVALFNEYEGSEAEKFIMAQSYLMTKLQLKVVNSDWMDAQFNLIRENRAILLDNKISKVTYPYLHPRMKHLTNLLRAFLDHCESSIRKYPSEDEEGQALFYVSYEQLSLLLDGKNVRTIKTQVAELTMLGLIRKVSDEEVKRVAPKRLSRSLELKKLNNHRHSIQYYSIPLWNTPVLINANEVKNIAKNNGITNKGLTQRAASAIDKSISTKVDYEETKYTKYNIREMEDWTKRTVKRKKVFLKEDFMKYAKSKNIGIRYAETILPVVVSTLELSRIVIKKDDIKKYSLSSKDLRKTAFIKK